MQSPNFCRIEYWNLRAKEWSTGHAGIALMNPRKYVDQAAKRGTIVRAVIDETGEVVYPDGGELL